MDNPVSRQALFSELYEHYFPMVKQICLGYCNGDRGTAQDIAQEVFINVWNGLERFRGEASHKTWLYRIAVNTCLLHLRSISKQPVTTNIDERHYEKSQEASSEVKIEVLYHTIGSLPPLERIIMMMVLEDLPYSEMATITGMNLINLRVKIHRIKNKMRQLIK